MNRIAIQKKVLSENDQIAARLRDALAGGGTLAVNLISSPGSGKTMLLEKTLGMLPRGTRAAVLTGDIQTDNDARRLARYGYPVRQITTAGACHLDARMVENHLHLWLDEGIGDPLDLLVIENVGNLVCPTSYDLGEDAKIVLLSVTEGEDKPLKYPTIFNSADVAVVTKIELAGAVEFDWDVARTSIQSVRPGMEIFRLSAKTGEGMQEYLRFLAQQRNARRVPATAHVQE
jgi:hydrogenase nickel incorporation protein HypB